MKILKANKDIAFLMLPNNQIFSECSDRCFVSLSCQDGWNQNHFLTPVSTLERDRFKSQPTLPTSTVQTSPINHPGRLWFATDPENRQWQGKWKTSGIPCLKCVSLQLPVPCRLLPCLASKSIGTPSEIIREHRQLCNSTKGTTAFIKNSIQVFK